VSDDEDATGSYDSDTEFQAWLDLPPGSYVWHVAEQRRGFDVVAFRAAPGEPGEVATMFGLVIRLDDDRVLRIGGWSTR
jgi:hypothetical protein